MHPTVCIISRSSPYNGEKAREALEFALASAACSIPTSILLVGEAVLQLADIKCNILGKKNIKSFISALPVYGIDKIYADATDIKAFNVEAVNHEGLQVSYLTSAEIVSLISSCDKLVNL